MFPPGGLIQRPPGFDIALIRSLIFSRPRAEFSFPFHVPSHTNTSYRVGTRKPNTFNFFLIIYYIQYFNNLCDHFYTYNHGLLLNVLCIVLYL